MFDETDDLRLRAEALQVDKTPQTTKLGIEIHEIDQHGDRDKLEALINGDEIHDVMPGVIAELMYGYFKTDLIKEGESISSAHANAKMFVKKMLANEDFGMSEEEIEGICNTHIDEKLESGEGDDDGEDE